MTSNSEGMQENIVKNQHLIPESLLEKFATKKQIFEALFIGDDSKVYPTNIDNSMCERFAYEHEDLKMNVIENHFGTIESLLAPKITALIGVIEDHKKGKASFSTIKSLIEELLPIFIVFYYRSGALLTEFSSINKKDKIPLLSKKILNQIYIDSLSKTIMGGYKLAVLESNDEFLLSDQYISTAGLSIKSNFFDISNRHIGLRETIVLIPISAKYYVMYWHTDNNSFPIIEEIVNHLNESLIIQINRTIINNSYRKCAGKKKSSLEAVIDKYTMAYPSQAYMGYKSGYTTGVIRKKEVFFYEVDTEAYEMLQHMRFLDYKKVGRNDSCLCGSKKKFKRCHEDAYYRLEPVVQSMKQDREKSLSRFVVSNAIVIELPIDQWGGFSEKVKDSMTKREKSQPM